MADDERPNTIGDDPDKLYLRRRDTGQIFGYNQKVHEYGTNMEIVTAEIAFPEHFMPVQHRGRKPKVDMSVEVPEPPKEVNEELAAEVTKATEAKMPAPGRGRGRGKAKK